MLVGAQGDGIDSSYAFQEGTSPNMPVPGSWQVLAGWQSDTNGPSAERGSPEVAPR